MTPLDKLLHAIENLPPSSQLLGNVCATDRYCLTTQNYNVHPREIIDENGLRTTQSLKAQHFSINVFNENDYNLFKGLIEEFISSTTEKFKVRIPKIRMTKEIIPRREFEDFINSVCLARKWHENMVDNLVTMFEKQLKDVGADVWIEAYNVKHWPEHCQFKEKWFEHIEKPDFTHHYQFGITFHKNTELYQRYKPIIRKIHAQKNAKKESEKESESEEPNGDSHRYIEQYRSELYGMRSFH